MTPTGSAQPPLRVLHLEDNPIDADLVRAVIEESWPGCCITALHTRADFAAALAPGRFDFILSDSSLPQFDGLAALALARQLSPGTPFLFLSGRPGEETARRAREEGAADYIVKDRIDLLPAAIHSVLKNPQK